MVYEEGCDLSDFNPTNAFDEALRGAISITLISSTLVKPAVEAFDEASRNQIL